MDCAGWRRWMVDQSGSTPGDEDWKKCRAGLAAMQFTHDLPSRVERDLIRR